jgi:hypothetical protein
MSRELMEKLGGIHHSHVATSIKFIQNMANMWQVDKITAHSGILAPSFHVSNDPPHARLVGLGNTKEWGRGKD